jgi:hypothetical protein
MNPGGVALASFVGLLAVYLYLNQSSHVTEHQDEAQAEMRCQKAEFDANFAAKWSDPPEKIVKLNARAEAECKQFEAKRGANEVVRVERAKDTKALQDTIGNMMK